MPWTEFLYTRPELQDFWNEKKIYEQLQASKYLNLLNTCPCCLPCLGTFTLLHFASRKWNIPMAALRSMTGRHMQMAPCTWAI